MIRRVAAVVAFGVTITATPRTAFAVQGGTIDTTSVFAVGVIGDDLVPCSGVLITPNVVLTARRCVQDAPVPIDCAQNPEFGGAMRTMEVITAPNMAGAPRRPVKTVVVPSTMAVCGNDLALLVLNDLVDAVTPIAPAVNEAPNHPKYSRELTAIGYGLTGPNATFDGSRRRIEKVTIACVPGDPSFPCPAGFDANELEGGNGLCDYDWGLAALEQASFASGAPIALGVLSRTGTNVAGDACEGSVFTRLDVHRDLIVDTAAAASSTWTLYAKPSWADPPEAGVAPPEPPDAGSGAADASTPPSGGGNGPPPPAGEEETAAPSDDGGCRSAPKMGSSEAMWGAGLLAGAVAVALGRRRRNGS